MIQKTGDIIYDTYARGYNEGYGEGWKAAYAWLCEHGKFMDPLSILGNNLATACGLELARREGKWRVQGYNGDHP